MNKIHKYVFLSLSIFSASFLFSQEISVSPSLYNFKKVNEGKQIQMTFEITNPFNDTLKILPPEIDCSCTQIQYTDYIFPNAKQTVKLLFDTDKKWGVQEREVKLTIYNKHTHKIQTLYLKFKGKVKATKATKQLIREQLKDNKKGK